MVDIISPRRGENIIDKFGVPTLRFFEYLEASTGQVNSTIPNSEVDAFSLDLSTAAISRLSKRTDVLELLIDTCLSQAGKINGLQKQINDLRLLVT